LVKVIVTDAPAGTVIVDVLNAMFWAVSETVTGPGMVGTVVATVVVGTVVTVVVGGGVVGVVVGRTVVAVVSGTTVVFGTSVVAVVFGTDVGTVVTGRVAEPGKYVKLGTCPESWGMYCDALNVGVGVTVGVAVASPPAGTVVAVAVTVGVATRVPVGAVASGVVVAAGAVPVAAAVVPRGVGVAFVGGVVAHPAMQHPTRRPQMSSPARRRLDVMDTQ
jgi:hypothetical protein